MGQKTAQRFCPLEQRYVLAVKRTPNHILHLLLSIVTGGLWLFVWLALIIISGESSYRCASCGSKTVRKPPKGFQPAKAAHEVPH
jgi:hypothetical protein